MLFLPILFLLSAFAQDELALETYCFPSEGLRAQVQKKLSALLVPSDRVESENSCLTIQMRPHRRELLQNYTRSLSPEMVVKFSSAEIRRDPCRLRVEKIRNGKKDSTTAEASSLPELETKSLNENGKDVMDIVTISDFSFLVNQDAIEGKCRFITEKLYEITLNARRDPKPVVPANLPPGTIVINQVPPADQKTLSLTTILQLKPGDRVEIGSIVRDLRKKAKSVDISPEAKMENSEGTEEEKVFLSFQTN